MTTQTQIDEISQNTTLFNVDLNDTYTTKAKYKWPITITNGVTVKLGEDIKLVNETEYFIFGSDNVTLDGQNYTITIESTDNYPGLVQNSKSNTTVKNIKLLIYKEENPSNLAEDAGWICQKNYSRNSDGFNNGKNNKIINCSSDGGISINGGGIIGSYALYLTVSNCYSTGNIGEDGGGIIGSSAKYVVVSNCYSTGNITSGGGIVGYGAEDVAISDCYSTGNVTGNVSNNYRGENTTNNFGGCIVGNRAITILVSNCYSTGNVTSKIGGGIIGAYSSKVEVSNCYSAGTIGAYGGSIVGAYTNKTKVVNCYSVYSVRIIGESGWEEINIQNSGSSNGSWSNDDARKYLTNIPTVWTYDFSDPNTQKPWLLSSFNKPFYNITNNTIIRNSSSYTSETAINTGYIFKILSVNNNVVVSDNVSINTSGIINVNNMTPNTPYDIAVMSYKGDNIPYDYSINKFKIINTDNLKSLISSSTNINQSLINSYRWPVTIIGGISTNPITITLDENITISEDQNLTGPNKYFIIGSDYITFDGNNKKITINGINNYPGLIKNGDSNTNGYSYNTIKNINMVSNNSTLKNNAGWICQTYYSNLGYYNLIENCNSNGNINSYSGGICGSNIASLGSISINKCFSSGSINDNAGGIIGAYPAIKGTVNITNCFSNGNITNSSGGIIGSGISSMFGTSETVKISNCYSRGTIDNTSGGISANWNGKSLNITNCYTYGQFTPYDEKDLKLIGLYANNSTIDNITVIKYYVANNNWNEIVATSSLDIKVDNINIWDTSTSPWILSSLKSLTPKQPLNIPSITVPPNNYKIIIKFKSIQKINPLQISHFRLLDDTNQPITYTTLFKDATDNLTIWNDSNAILNLDNIFDNISTSAKSYPKIYHSNNNDGYINLILQTDKIPIKLELYNRGDCCFERLESYSLTTEIYDSNNKNISSYTYNLKKDLIQTYTITLVPTTQPPTTLAPTTQPPTTQPPTTLAPIIQKTESQTVSDDGILYGNLLLKTGDKITNTTDGTELVLQNDGNLVIYNKDPNYKCSSKQFDCWASLKENKAVHEMIILNGNLKMKDTKKNTISLSIGTNATFKLNNGNLWVFENGKVIARYGEANRNSIQPYKKLENKDFIKGNLGNYTKELMFIVYNKL